MKKLLFVFFSFVLCCFFSCGEIDINEITNNKDGDSSATTRDSVDSLVNKGDTQSGDSLKDSVVIHSDSTAVPTDTVSKDSGDGDETTSSSMDTTMMACFTADGHLLIADSFYLSTTEYYTVHSAYYAAAPTEAVDKAAAYTEGNLSDWHVPTVEEAQFLISIYGGTLCYYGTTPLPCLNRALNARDLDMIDLESRYLCADGQKTFSLKSGSNITKGGKSTTYRLRLVHEKQKGRN